MCPIYDVLSHFMMFCCKIVIYAVLSRYLFCRDLRAFAWRKIQPRITPRGEEMTNIRYAPPSLNLSLSFSYDHTIAYELSCIGLYWGVVGDNM